MPLASLLLLTAAAATVHAQSASASAPASSSSTGLLAQSSPSWLASIGVPSGVATSYPTGQIDTGATLSTQTLNLTAYPSPWTAPPTDSAEVQAVYNAIDWTHVPNATVHKASANGDLDMTGYDLTNDPYCWWSDTNCVMPKVNYLPQDIYYCPRVGDWGLTYDDGPFNPTGDNATTQWSEPNLYNFLAEHNNQKATLFYIGSNVATYPAAAQRAINDGHVICVHTWSHPPMTTKSNVDVVAEFYWTLRAIKEATGVTPKCWRPPYGDVDDRVRAIAWQMGMRTIIWDEDTNDWNMPGDGGGTLAPSTVHGYFEGWIEARKNGSDNAQGHIVLEHELNNSTVSMAEKWLPTLQQTFNVVTVQACMNVSQPYWEESWVYPTEAHNSTETTNITSSASAGSTSAGQSAGASGSAASQGASSDAPRMALSIDMTMACVAVSLALEFSLY